MDARDRARSRERRIVRLRGLKQGLAIGAAVTALSASIAGLIWASHALGNAARLPTPVGGAVHTRPSPRTAGQKDQGRIVFASRDHGRYHLHLINPDGTGETSLTFGKGEEFEPAWSPDRQLIAFAGSPGARTPRVDADIHVVRADGTGLVRITHGPENAEDPSWSPDGTHIVFSSSDRSTGRTRIRIASLDGSTLAQLPDPPEGCIDREPAWSPDGVTIAFVRLCQNESSRLLLVHLDGTGQLQLEGFGRTPAWSPDGSKLAYTGFGHYAPAIFIVNADGSGKVQLTTDGTGDPAWSPDGSRIAFTLGGLGLRLFVIDTDGNNQRPLTDGTSDQLSPAW